VVEVAVPVERWPLLTDLGVTLFDSTGHQIAQQPQNYAVGRQTVALDSAARGRPLLVELAPAWADAAVAGAWEATVTVRFALASPVPVADVTELRLVPGGRALVPLARATLPPPPPGFEPWLEVAAGVAGAPRAILWATGGSTP
jgi:hypothetical protein